MFRNLLAASAIASVFLMSAPSHSRAAGADGAVNGTGHVDIKRPPEILRAEFTLTAEGKDITEATTKLKAAQADARSKLKDLGAIEKSIDVSSIQIGGALDPRQQYMQRMMMRGNRGAKPVAPAAPSVTVSSKVTAEWPVTKAAPDELLVTGYTLQEKIKGSGIGKSEAKKLTPEEQEAAEEAAAATAQNGETVTPGEPTFVYVSKVAAEDRATAMADAFKRAKADATALAKASGNELGELRQISSSISTPSNGPENEQELYMKMMVRQMTGSTPPSATDTPQDEATSATPGLVRLIVAVSASFDLKK